MLPVIGSDTADSCTALAAGERVYMTQTAFRRRVEERRGKWVAHLGRADNPDFFAAAFKFCS